MLSSLCSRLNRCCYTCSIVIPLGSVYSLITWAWITFSGTICVYSIGGAAGFSLAFVSTILYCMVFWSYTAACFVDPGSPSKASENQDGTQGILPHHRAPQASFNAVTVKDDGSERYCQKCDYRKPDRTHHCRSCRRCILKMDHHCPWLATCVGYHNYKQFILFLTYVSVWCLFMCLVTALFLWTFFTENVPEKIEAQFLPINWVVLLVLSGVVGLVVGLFAAWHISLTMRNYTTIEYMEETRFKGDQKRYLTAQSPKDKFNIFDIGYRKNWEQVMGSSPMWWVVPMTQTMQDGGFAFDISERARERLLEQQHLRSFERDEAAERRFNQQYELRDFRESFDWDRERLILNND